MTTRGSTECITMHTGQWSAPLSTECAKETWATANSNSKTRHTATTSPKALGFGR